MKILIVEDDLNKSRQIGDYLSELLPGVELVERRSFQSGLAEIYASAFDVVILDMTLPTYDIRPGERGGRTRTYGGREILEELVRNSISTKAIVLTQFESFGEGGDHLTLDELTEQVKARFPKLFLGTVYYHPARTDWRTRLNDLLAIVCEGRLTG